MVARQTENPVTQEEASLFLHPEGSATEAQSSEDPLADILDLGALSETEFKTVATSGGRKGVRLETTFWRALTVLGHINGQKRSDVVAQIVLEAQRIGINATSALRSFVVDRLLTEVERLRPVATTQNITRMMQYAPVPAFAFDRQMRLTSANGEFRRYLRMMSGETSAPVMPEKAHLAFDRPVRILLADIEARGVVESSVLITLGLRERRTLARFVAIPPSPCTLFVAYLLQ